MATTARFHRQKISTTIAPETLAYLERQVDSGEAATLAEAIDKAVERLRAIENRERLERDTAAYFDGMTEEELAEENRLASALVASARTFDVDHEL
jgi:Arc/MetJ-type ribon-helix-helix transcriptional regulator